MPPPSGLAAATGGRPPPETEAMLSTGTEAGSRELAIVGRSSELERIRSLVAGARSGTSGVLVVSGPAGIGKTTLLRTAFAETDGFATLTVDGVEPEVGMAHGALHRLLAQVDATGVELPGPQQRALDVIFGRRGGEPPDPFLVGLAVLTTLTDAARRRPLICVVDDVHWVDPPSLQALALVARRLLADPLVLVLATRPEPVALHGLAGLPSLELGPLPREECLRLLRGHGGPVLEHVERRLLDESAGNPLALVEYARGVARAAGPASAQAVDPEPLPARLERLFDQEILGLPEGGRLLLTAAALEPSGDAGLIRRSAQAVGVDLTDEPETQLGRLASLEPRVTFAHPLVRSAAHRLATRSERRRIHSALAHLNQDVIRRAWHLAHAAEGVDDAIAEELDRAAIVARTRGGHVAEAELLRRAAELTSDAEARDGRLLRSANAAFLGGEARRALEIAPVEAAVPGGLTQAKTAMVRAKATMRLGGFRTAPEAFAEAARTLQRLDPGAAREAWQHAVNAALVRGDPEVLDAIAHEARSAGVADHTKPVVRDLVVAAVVLMQTGDETRARSLMRDALGAAEIDDPGAAAAMEASLGVIAGWELFDPAAARRLIERLRTRDLRNGALENLQVTTSTLGTVAALRGRLDEAFRLFEESADFARAYASMFELPVFTHLAFGGRDAELEAASRIATHMGAELGIGATELCTQWTQAELCVGRSRWSEAVALLRRSFDTQQPFLRTLVLPSMIEAAARAGQDELARSALDRLTARAAATGTPWGRGLVARCTAIVAGDDEAERLYREAIERFAEADMPLDRARAELLYGEWLRRQRRRTDALEHLGAAHDAFTAMDARAYADRARAELEAAGGHARRRTGPGTRDDLTLRERQVAKAASMSQTNREIAAQMFISEATVAYHLRKVFQKLDVTSRRDLRHLEL